MLTLVKTADAVPLVGIYEVPEKKPGSKLLGKLQAAKKKQVGTVYFTHELDQNWISRTCRRRPACSRCTRST